MQGYFTLLGAPTHGKSILIAREGLQNHARAGIYAAPAWPLETLLSPIAIPIQT
jgi:hypothetical protein